MFKHLLLPTDGSATSELAIAKAMTLAKECGARVTGLHVIQPFHVFAYDVEMIEDNKVTYLAQAEARAARYLAVIGKAAEACQVACELVSIADEHPYEAIVRTAKARACDLIVMASHGRRGIRSMLMGSETHKVLTHSHVPVLVWR